MIVAGKSNTEIFKELPLITCYFICKAHKLSNTPHFYSFWQDGRSKELLITILQAYYPPQEYCNSLQEAITNTGFEDLARYKQLADTVFKDTYE